MVASATALVPATLERGFLRLVRGGRAGRIGLGRGSARSGLSCREQSAGAEQHRSQQKLRSHSSFFRHRPFFRFQTTPRKCWGRQNVLRHCRRIAGAQGRNDLTADVNVFQPANEFRLPGNNFALPKNCPEHQAHRHGAHSQSDAHLAFARRNAKPLD